MKMKSMLNGLLLESEYVDVLCKWWDKVKRRINKGLLRLKQRRLRVKYFKSKITG